MKINDIQIFTLINMIIEFCKGAVESEKAGYTSKQKDIFIKYE